MSHVVANDQQVGVLLQVQIGHVVSEDGQKVKTIEFGIQLHHNALHGLLRSLDGLKEVSQVIENITGRFLFTSNLIC